MPSPIENTASVILLSKPDGSSDCPVVVMIKSIMTVELSWDVPRKCQMRSSPTESPAGPRSISVGTGTGPCVMVIVSEENAGAVKVPDKIKAKIVFFNVCSEAQGKYHAIAQCHRHPLE